MVVLWHLPQGREYRTRPVVEYLPPTPSMRTSMPSDNSRGRTIRKIPLESVPLSVPLKVSGCSTAGVTVTCSQIICINYIVPPLFYLRLNVLNSSLQHYIRT